MAAGPVNEGRVLMLNVMFHGTAASGTWYIGLIDGSSTPTFDVTYTMGAHAGWTEIVPYSDATRPAWPEDIALAPGTITNSTTADFNINATATVYGIFLTSDNTKSGTAGTLFATAQFSGGNQSVANGDTLKVTINITLT